jgi:hypothetical protein
MSKLGRECSSGSDSSEEIQCGQRIQEHEVQIKLISGEKEDNESTQEENIEDEDLLVDEDNIVEEMIHKETIPSSKVKTYNEEPSDEEDINEIEVVTEESEENISQEITLAQKTKDKEETSPPKKKLNRNKYI